MILADKILKLRKQSSWSQEELAVRLGVSRQSVSKWESGTSLPDLDKIVKLSKMFGVTTDYLLRDELEEIPAENQETTFSEEWEKDESMKTVTLAEAGDYLELVRKAAIQIAAAIGACILSPVFLILLCGMAESQVITLSEDAAGGIGVAVLLVMIAGAVGVFISNGIRLGKYEYLEQEPIQTEYGVAGLAESRKEKFSATFQRSIITGIILCILSVVPLMFAAGFHAPEIFVIYCVCGMLAMVALGVVLFIWAGMIYDSFRKLLEEEEYSREKKREKRQNDPLSGIYWCVVTAIYLGISFLTRKWGETWIIWPVAGVFFAAFYAMINVVRGRKQ